MKWNINLWAALFLWVAIRGSVSCPRTLWYAERDDWDRTPDLLVRGQLCVRVCACVRVCVCACVCVCVCVCTCDVTVSGSLHTHWPMGVKRTRISRDVFTWKRTMTDTAETVKSCCAINCTNTSRNNSSKSFQRLLRAKERRVTWRDDFQAAEQHQLTEHWAFCFIQGLVAQERHVRFKWIRFHCCDRASLLPECQGVGCLLPS